MGRYTEAKHALARSGGRGRGGARFRVVGGLIIAVVVTVSLPRVGAQVADGPGAAAMPAEEDRLDRATFRSGLKKRGLTDLLELHLRDFPPSGEVDALLMQRDLKLAAFVDPNRTDEERMRAIREANEILEKLIEEHDYDLRRFDWQFSLAHSLIYDEAEPFIASILYRGGTRAERAGLLRLTERAVAVVTSLTQQLAEEYKRVDDLPVAQFEQFERSGYIAHVDRLGPRVDYLMLWALLYDSVARDDADRTRAARLNRIRAHLAAHPDVLDTPHHMSHIQIQALVLAGMTERMLNDHVAARQYLDRAMAVADRVIDDVERGRVQWAVTLAAVESIRNDRDDGRFPSALGTLARFRHRITLESGGNFGLQIVGALLERSVHRARAMAAENDGRTLEAGEYREEAWQPLARLVQRFPERRDEVYATLTAINGSDAPLTQLDPFDQCALIAGLLFDAGESADEDDPRLARAVEVGVWFLEHAGGRGQSMVPEVVYNVAVAEYRRGRFVEAARRFLDVARDHGSWENALPAAVHAVQLTADLYQDPQLRDHPELQQLYRDSLDTLVTGYADTEAARYWRYYYAQLLDELGEYDGAATQYALVDAGHEHYLEAGFARVRCVALGLQELPGASPVDQIALQKRSADFFSLQREFVSRASGERQRASEPKRAGVITRLMARATLLGAEIQVLGSIDRPRAALEGLAGFEAEYPQEDGLIGRVWRVRLLAHERLGQLDEAAKAIPAYVAADPEDAGPTLQSLYSAIVGDVERARGSGDERAAQHKAEIAVLVAEQIVAWADRYDPDAPVQERRRRKVQLAQANLLVGKHQRARELFEQCLTPRAESALPNQPIDLHVMYGLAEAEFQLGEWQAALPRFNALAVGLPANDPLRFRALLRDLQCRTALKHPPRGILKVIEQQRFLYPDLGGPAMAEEFARVERAAQRRGDVAGE